MKADNTAIDNAETADDVFSRTFGLCAALLRTFRDGGSPCKADLETAICAADLCLDLCGDSNGSEPNLLSGSTTASPSNSEIQSLAKPPGSTPPSSSTLRAATLPPELLRFVFGYVTGPIPKLDPHAASLQRAIEQRTLLSCAAVNWHWKQSATPLLWRDPHVVSRGAVKYLILGARLNKALGSDGSDCGRLKRGNGVARSPSSPFTSHQVQRLDLRDISLEEPKDTRLLRIIADTFPRLRVLRLHVGHFRQSTLNHIFSSCPDIDIFSLRGSAYQDSDRSRVRGNGDGGHRGVNGDESWDAVWSAAASPAFAGALCRLEGLDLYNVSYETHSSFHLLIQTSLGSSLRHLNLGRTWVVDEVIIAIARRCPELRGVWLEENIAITDASVSFLASACPHLETVKLRNCIGLTDVCIVEIARRCRNLQALGISYSRCSDGALRALARYSQNLHTLFMNDLSLESEDSVVELIQQRGAGLKSWGMCGCDVVSDRSITAISRICKQLEELDIGQCGDPDAGATITEDGIEELVKGCRKLKTLVVHDIDGLSEEYVETLGKRICTTQFWLEPPGW
ncbi:hypothetical protein HK104_000584 [Borealophlyctis nickersoniae]|nr:hypothetical protein HK104_000584 [Borealophlyctis nickersoniae]